MATPLATTDQGYEAQFGTNHIGHALLTKLLMPALLKTAEDPTADVRIVTVSSLGHNLAPQGGIIFNQDELMKHGPFPLYGQSKLANILFSKALAKRYPQVTSVAVHPGTIMTDLYAPQNKSNFIVGALMSYVAPLFFGDVEFGALNQLWAATVPKTEIANGGYFMPVGRRIGGSKYARDEKLADKLWDWTEGEFSKHGL
jgi:NAD(P)-dependent dehydrogenase (short-subunit alcohol dehydrogenase family)